MLGGCKQHEFIILQFQWESKWISPGLKCVAGAEFSLESSSRESTFLPFLTSGGHQNSLAHGPHPLSNENG